MCDNKRLALIRARHILLTGLIVFAAEVVVAVISDAAGFDNGFLFALAIILMTVIAACHELSLFVLEGQYFFDNETVSTDRCIVRTLLIVLNAPCYFLYVFPLIPLPIKILLALINVICCSRKAHHRLYLLSKGSCTCIKGKMSSKWIRTIRIPLYRCRFIFPVVLFEPEEGNPVKVSADLLTYIGAKNGMDAVLAEYKTGEDQLYVELIPIR